MEMKPQAPTLKIGKGEIAKIKLADLAPFKEGSNEWDGVAKKWFGYNLTKDATEYVYFASEAVHTLIQQAKPEGEFTLELRSVNNKQGELRSIWYLNGMNLWQYQENNVMDKPQSNEVNIQAGNNNSWENTIEERLDKLEKQVYSNTVKTEDNIPF